MAENTMKLDLGCGDNKREGFTGIDKFKTDSTDIEADLFVFPWPLESDSVDEVHCSHFFEHVPAAIKPKFMDELFRVMKVGATAQFITPSGDRHKQDFTHDPLEVVPGSYLYFNADWRKQNKLQHGAYDLKCDFDYGYGHSLDPQIAVRNADFQAFAVRFYNNATTDLHVTLTKRG